ncbi:RmlC-like cupin domain-containing protein [Amylocystis lapponica]|nr:RmlC-like cupin domain-containing protein [Amylocystis lapponica]
MANAAVSTSNLIRLKTTVQQYDWGKQGRASLAATLANNAVGPDFQLDPSKSYAEHLAPRSSFSLFPLQIWMGTHTNGPSMLFSTPTVSLHKLLSANPAPTLGAARTKWPASTHLPFLFKILSIAKALPLQAHPDKALAERLRDADPEHAPDNNHKPEIAVVIGAPLARDALAVGATDTAFTAFVGFRPLEEIATAMRAVPELRRAVGNDGAVDAFVRAPNRAGLKKVWGALLRRAAEGDVHALVERVRTALECGRAAEAVGGGARAEELARLVLKVDQQYPGDVGVLATVFFMNFVTLRRGEALYIGADEVHAYLEGDIIECMAVSDNVMNATFVPKDQREVPTFVEMLTYTARPPAHWALQGHQFVVLARRCARMRRRSTGKG